MTGTSKSDAYFFRATSFANGNAPTASPVTMEGSVNPYRGMIKNPNTGSAMMPLADEIDGILGQGVEADALLASHLVEEDVRRDAVEPALERARLVRVKRTEDPHEDVVGQVLRVVGVAGQAVGQPVDPRRVLLDDFLPRRGGPDCVAHRPRGSIELRELPVPSVKTVALTRSPYLSSN